MKQIVMISDATTGGAAVACGRLCGALRQQPGVDVTWLALRGEEGGGARIAAAWPPVGSLIWRRIRGRYVRSEGALRQVEARFNEASLARLLARVTPDLISLHGLHEGMSFGLLDRLPSHTPLVWTLHDMWPITGYCYYGLECEKYLDGCRGACPQMGKCGAAVRTPAEEWVRRDRALRARRGRIALVAPSRWLAECANRRFKGELPTHVIPNAVNTAVFRPIGDRAAVRRALGLPAEGAILLSGAVSIHDERKGGAFLLDAARKLQAAVHGPVRLVLFGSKAGNGADLPDGTVCTGPIRDEALLNLYYNAADVFVLPSLAEAFGLVFAEAMAAGTPSVCFDVGGCRDTVRDGVTGFRARPGDSDDLAGCTRRVLEMPEPDRANLSRTCRMIAEREYSLATLGTAYARLFDTMLAPTKGAR